MLPGDEEPRCMKWTVESESVRIDVARLPRIHSLSELFGCGRPSTHINILPRRSWQAIRRFAI